MTSKTLSNYPKLMKEWDWDANKDLDPKHIAYMSNLKVSWICERHHKWTAAVSARVAGTNCPYCSNKKVLSGYNDVATTHPSLISEWDFNKNTINPTDVTAGSNKKIWWRCKKGHEWLAVIYSRASNGVGCPYCSNRLILSGYNDLLTVNPRLAQDWDYARNKIGPDKISPNSHNRAYWKCLDCGNEWCAPIIVRNKGRGCPVCSKKHLSQLRMEKALKEKGSLESTNAELVSEWDFKKNSLHPSEITATDRRKVWWKCSKGHEWQSEIYVRTALSSGCPVCSNQKVLSGYNDLAHKNPQLAGMWNYEKNHGLKPEEVIYGGKKKYWWKCSKGHEWQSEIRKEYEMSCPICEHRTLLKGFNDLATMAPEIVSEFDAEKNGKAPEDVLFTLNIRPYWWKCSKGHSFKAPIRNRTKLGLGCPYCSNQKTMAGFNDILSDADMAKEWNYEKNKGLDPSKINHHSIKKVWWRCKYGHEWRMSPYGKQGCPVCNSEKKTSLPEKTVFFYVKRYFPDSLENYSAPGIGKKNLDIFIPSNRIAIEYDGSHYHDDIERDKEKDKLCLNSGIILYRIREDRCPILDSTSFCIVMKNAKQVELEKAIKRLLMELGIRNPEVNINQDLSSINELLISSRKAESLLLLYPAIAKQWDYEKNGSITPDMVSAKSGKMFWWKCNKGHSYQAKVGDKTSKKNNCPICANRRVLTGVNDLATLNPTLAKQWDYEKNQLSPENVVYGGTKEFWWKCNKGHSWKTSVRVRARGNGCPYCSHRKLLTGFNDLETINPKLAKEWNYEKNGTLKPSDVFPSSIQKVWWKCDKCGHEWESSINNRSGSKGRGCPNCHKTKR